MNTIKLLGWAVWHLCTAPFVEFVELIKAIREMDKKGQ